MTFDATNDKAAGIRLVPAVLAASEEVVVAVNVLADEQWRNVLDGLPGPELDDACAAIQVFGLLVDQLDLACNAARRAGPLAAEQRPALLAAAERFVALFRDLQRECWSVIIGPRWEDDPAVGIGWWLAVMTQGTHGGRELEEACEQERTRRRAVEAAAESEDEPSERPRESRRGSRRRGNGVRRPFSKGM